MCNFQVDSSSEADDIHEGTPRKKMKLMFSKSKIKFPCKCKFVVYIGGKKKKN